MTLRDLNQLNKDPSPKRETLSPLVLPALPVQAHPPPGLGTMSAGTLGSLGALGNLATTGSSAGTPRRLRRLQSAHTLGAKSSAQPSFISQHRLQPAPSLQQLQPALQPTLQSVPQQNQPYRPRRSLGLASFATLAQQREQQLQQSEYQQQQQLQPPTLRKLPSPVPSPRSHASSNRSPQRARSNSDAPPMPAPVSQLNTMAQVVPRRSVLSRRSLAADAMSLERLLREGPPDGDVEGAIESTRLKILDQGIKADSDGMSSLRIYVWLILLNCPIIETDTYLALIHRGASPAYSKIRNDTFRTLTTDPLFRRRVSEASLIRLLNAIAWVLHDARESRARTPSIASSSRQSVDQSNSRPGTGYSGYSSSSHPTSSPSSKNRGRALTLTTEGSEASCYTGDHGTYVQGMNVLAAPFLYAARSEAEAFVAFHQLLTRELPGYIRGAMDGVHKGLALVDKVLAIVDPKLSLYLLSKNLSAEIYAFPSVLTLCACTPPLPEVLKLWDFLFAYGPHLNILCIVAQLVMIRNKILESPSPNKLLRSFPPLQADQIKRTTLAIIKMIPDDVYAEIVAHAR